MDTYPDRVDENIPVEPPEPSFQHPPRLWTVFVVCALTFCVIVAVEFVAVVALAFSLLSQGVDIRQLQAELEALIRQPTALVLLGILSQIVMLAGALIPACLSPVPFRERLGLVPIALNPSSWGLVIVGTILVAAVDSGIEDLVALVLPKPKGVQMVMEALNGPGALPVFLYVTLMPSFVEEFFFRGYMQRRLLQRLRPWVAILISSVLFSAYHINPCDVLAIFPAGVWLGYVAWRFGSIWPCVLAHALYNAGACIAQICLGGEGAITSPPLSASVLIACVALVILVAVIAIFERHTRALTS